MTDNTAARARILAAIRSAYATEKQITDSFEAVPRAYLRAGTLDPEARLALFSERLREYNASVFFAPEDALANTIGKILEQRNRSRIVVPDDFPSALLPGGFQFTPGNDLEPRTLDSYDGVLTGCTIAIALTGTLVLQNAPAQGPRALSLIPDYHLCVVFPAQVVETVPEAFERLKPTELRPTTFISGPSATSDIEMTRINGVHGPRLLDVLIATS